MTRRISSYISVLLTAAFALASCDKEPAIAPADSQTLTICLSPADMELTRAESEYGSEDYNENVINSFKLYFYTSDSETETAVYVYPEDNTLASLTNAGATGYTTNKLTQDPESGKVTLSIALDKKVGDALSQNGKSSNCYVYAVANIPSSVSLPYTPGVASTSRESLKKIPVTASFGPDASVTADPYASRQTDFVMDGSAVLSIDSDKRITVDKTLTGSEYVEMSRAAAKITFYITEIKNVFETSATGDVTGVWIADVDKMRVAYKNTVNYGFIGSETSATDRDGKTASYSTSQGRLLKYSDKTVVKSKHVYISGTELADSTVTFTDCTHPLPFYSYFDEWTSSNDSSAPYLLVQIPWKYTKLDGSGTRYFTCYYAVPFNSITRVIDRNTWYKVSLSVSILGSGDPDNPTEITPSYMVLPWGSNPVQTNADLKRYRYLLVDQNEYVMNNVDSLEIPFYSSHKVKLLSASLTKMNLNPSSTTYEPKSETVTFSTDSLIFDNDALPGKSTVTFKHHLVNDYSKDYDVTAYTLKFYFQHDSGDSEDKNFKDSVTVVQYPALYVVAELNSDCTSSSATTQSGSHNGYVYVNGGQNARSSWEAITWDVVTTGGNYDPYRYVVTVSSLPDNSSYVIGDPRTADTVIPTLSGGRESWATANDMDDNSRQIKYYHPSDTDGDRVNNMIAPSFRIASSYGVAYQYSYDNAKKRCASYQEDGYPAGRWRIPTKAEIEYMAMLAGDGKIPVLLSTKTRKGRDYTYYYYWGADGNNYSPDGTNPGENSTAGIRCVYDAWYWKDTCTKTTFTWGDK